LSGVLQKTEEFVRDQMNISGNDSSHDWWHVHRVRNLALKLAQEEGIPSESLEMVQLAALMHDLHDWKYSGSTTEGVRAALEFLEQQGYNAEKAQKVASIIRRIGFKDELQGSKEEMFPELAVVQDADRLDAIGAIGIARCLTFGGKFNRVLHDPEVKSRETLTKEEYMDKNVEQTTMNHFPEKLLKLQGMMKTDAGRRYAIGRHKVMEAFLTQFYNEWDGTA